MAGAIKKLAALYYGAVQRRIRCHKARKVFHACHGATHLCYFAAVYVEGHGFYAATGGALLILGVVGVVIGGNDHER